MCVCVSVCTRAHILGHIHVFLGLCLFVLFSLLVFASTLDVCTFDTLCVCVWVVTFIHKDLACECVCLCVCICLCVCVCVCMRALVHIHVNMRMCGVCVGVCMRMCVYV